MVFGPGDETTPEGRARRSPRVFVRGLDQIAEDSRAASGRRLTAREALDAYGYETLQEVALEGSARLAPSADTAGRALRSRREELALEVRDVARRASVSPEEVQACEESRRLPLRTYERIARSLGLDERFVAVLPEPRGNEKLAVRLRNIGGEHARLGPGTVSALAEAAWVAAAQSRLADAFGLGFDRHDLSMSANYGSPGFPAYRWGYRLAADVRQKLGKGDGSPIPSLRDVVEDLFRISLIQCDLVESLAGATIDTGSSRAIVVNLSGRNKSVFTRRMTMAHELGHLLFDPVERLDMLRVDGYDDLDRAVQQVSDSVEQRANAFSAELLAPREAMLAAFRSGMDMTGLVDQFGISPTAGQHQLRNASDEPIPPQALRIRPRRDDEAHGAWAHWEGAESYTIEFHPIPGLRPSRAGRFSALTVRGAEEGVISWDTAAEWLESSQAVVRAAASDLRELYPSVWATGASPSWDLGPMFSK
jgi:hypothetical protein